MCDMQNMEREISPITSLRLLQLSYTKLTEPTKLENLSTSSLAENSVNRILTARVSKRKGDT